MHKRTNEIAPKLELCELMDTGMPELPTYSPFSLKVHRALALHGLAYERLLASHPAAWKHLNPRGQVPVLLVDGDPVYDSTAILRALEELSSRSLVPRDPAVAAQAWLMEDWADQSLNGYLVASRWADDRNWPKVRAEFFGAMPAPLRAVVPGRLRRRVVKRLVGRDIWLGGEAQCWSRFEHILDDLETLAPAEGFWFGAPSVADAALFGQLQSLRSELTPWQRGLVEARPRLTRYLDRVCVAGPREVGHLSAA